LEKGTQQEIVSEIVGNIDSTIMARFCDLLVERGARID